MAKGHLTIPVEGLKCGVCASNVKRRIRAVEGVSSASVNFTTGLASVVSQGDGVASRVVQALREGGYDCRRTNLTLAVPGLRDRADLEHVRRMVSQVPGVLDVRPNAITETLAIQYVPGSATLKSYEFTLEALGFTGVSVVTAGLLDETMRPGGAGRRLVWMMTGALVAWLVTLVAALPSAADQGFTFFGWLAVQLIGPVQSAVPTLFELNRAVLSAIMSVVSLGAIAAIARHDIERAWRSVHVRSADQHTLLGVGLVVAWVFATVSAFLDPGSSELLFPAIHGVLAFVMFSRWLEQRSFAKLGEDLQPLTELLPPKTHIEREGAELDVVLQDIAEGDRVVVKPGETIPVDGVVISGESDVDESNLTGDELPVTKSRGSLAYAGTINGRGTFAMEVTATGNRTGIATTVAAVSQADLFGVGAADLTDGIVRWLVPVSMAVATLTFGVWFALGASQMLNLGVSGMLAVLVVTIPRAFVNSTPLAYLSALNYAVRHGLVIRSAGTLDKLAGIDTVVFDRSGTLTKGEIMVSHVLGAERTDGATVSPTEILRLAAAVESQSRHPAGKAVVVSAHSRNIDIAGVERFVAMSGRGVRGVVGRFLVEVISVSHARERNHDLGALSKKVENHVLQGRMPVVVVVNDTVQGLIVFSEEIRPAAKRAVRALLDMGLDVMMLSGDSKAGAGLTAKEIGIDRVLADVAPEAKAEEIGRLQWDGRSVLAIADGLVDAEALSEARVGLAIGARGAMLEAASDVTVVNDDLMLVPASIKLARHTVMTSRANLRLLLGYHVLGIPLAAGVMYPLTGFVMGPAVAGLLALTWTTLVVSRSLAVRQFAPSDG